MKRCILIALLIISALPFNSRAQVKLMDMAHLKKRISNPDTIYVVNFWATWCGPCVAELPNFEKLQKINARNKLKVLLISMDFKSKLNTVVIPYVRSHKMNLEVYLAEHPDEQAWIEQVDKSWSGALPATLVVNQRKGIYSFYEKDFTFNELNKIYQTVK